MMRVVPSGLGGTFTWTQHCCTITGYGNQFWWAHERYCYCGGCYAYGYYSYEGYEKECTGGHCGCPYYDDESITKHSHCIDRNTNDVIRLDGVEVHDGGHRR